jgi:hypothetical protein
MVAWLAGDCLLPALSVLGFSFFKFISVCLQESFRNHHLLFGESFGKSVCKPSSLHSRFARSLGKVFHFMG